MLGKRRTANESLIFPSESQWVEPPSPSDRSDAEYTFDISKDDTTGEVAAGTFNRYGMYIAKGLVSEATANKAYEGAKQVYDSLIEKMKANGLPALGIGTKQGYAEIVQRTKDDLRLTMAWISQSFRRGVLQRLAQLISARRIWKRRVYARAEIDTNLLPRRAKAAVARRRRASVVRETSEAARYKRLRSTLLIDANMGPTEIRPASQFLTRKLTSMMLAAKARKQLHAPVKPTFSAGDALIFDYRTLHRGTLHVAGKTRALLELVYFKNGYVDILNFLNVAFFIFLA